MNSSSENLVFVLKLRLRSINGLIICRMVKSIMTQLPQIMSTSNKKEVIQCLIHLLGYLIMETMDQKKGTGRIAIWFYNVKI